MNYTQALEYIESLGVFGIRPGLERMEYLLEQLGNPQQQLKCIHVAGTNGKGSVCSMLETMLGGAFKVGKFTSPHLVSYNERFCLGQQQISDTDFADLTARVAAVAQNVSSDLQPTQFEVLTAMAFLFFAEQRVDYAIIEVGLGGTLDSTNVLTPLCSVIVNVAMDHMDKCGDSLARIAAHKAGIIKPGVPVVTGATGEALAVIERTAAAQQSPLLVYGRDFTYTKKLQKLENYDIINNGQKFIFNMRNQHMEVAVKLLGAHQLNNACVALAALQVVLGRERTEQLSKYLVDTVWPGRIEIVAERPTIILDGAHNTDGAKVLRQALDEVFSGKKICFILGFMKDKDIASILRELLRDEDEVIAVIADSGYSRSAEFDQIRAGSAHPMEFAATHAEAIRRAKQKVGTDGIVCIAGSLYLIGKIKTNLLELIK